MRCSSPLLICGSLLVSSLGYSEELAFHNILTTSRTIISPSQYYQVMEGALVEGEIGFTDGSTKIPTPTFDGVTQLPSGTITEDYDIKGTRYGAAGFLALNPSLVLGVNVKMENSEIEDVVKGDASLVSPSVTYSPITALSFGLQANIGRGQSKVEGETTEKANFSTVTFGMTAHQEMWEATAVMTTENKDDDTGINNRPKSLGLHARYRLIDPITLGISFGQRDYAELYGNDTEAKNETELGVHLESAMSETFSIEVDYLSTSEYQGAKDYDASEFVLLGQFLITSTLEAGARLSYKNIDGILSDSSTVSPSFFLASRF